MLTLAVEQLEPGLVLDQDIYNGSTLLLKAGTEVTSELVIRLRQRNIDQLSISENSQLGRRLLLHQDACPGLELTRTELFRRHGITSAIPEELLEQATAEVQRCFSQIELGGCIELEPLRGLVKNLVSHMLANPEGAPKLFSLRDFDQYTYRHSINVGLLMLLVLKDWQLSEAQLNDLVLGALLHDLGKMRVGAAIINKQGPLDDEEWQAMKQHPLWSLELIGKDAQLPPEALSLVRSHHERMDGRGYPDGARAGELERVVRLAAVCDVYDALTSRRSYKGKIEFAAAVNILLESSGSHFDPGLLNEFVRRIGLYPVGTLVKLSNGSTAVVVRANPQSVTRPLVSPVRDSTGVLCAKRDWIDLAAERGVYILGSA
jgi:HD-GYP domain-containing protein (c-di-GMP phosphodiesterase class II)